MPHITVEYTDNLKDNIDFKALFIKIHEIIHDIIHAPIHVCESQARKMNQAIIGDGHPHQAMVKLEIHLLEGRTPELKAALGERVLAYLISQYPNSIEQLSCQVIVRLIEIEREHYFHFSSAQ
ncbi:MAG: isomerase [Gammaproteobacteria bacterium]